MTAPTPPAPVQYALTALHMGAPRPDGPWLLTADPVTAARFLLDNDRPPHTSALAHTAGPDGALTPLAPGTLLERALESAPEGDERRPVLRTAQADWISARMPSTHTDWIRPGEAWGTVFGTVPGRDVLALLAERHPGTEEPHGPLVVATLVGARAVRQASGTDRSALAAAWLVLNQQRREPAARAAADRCLQRLADLDPLTAHPPRHLTGTRLEAWQRQALDLQRDLLLHSDDQHPALVAEFTTATTATDADVPATDADVPATDADVPATVFDAEAAAVFDADGDDGVRERVLRDALDAALDLATVPEPLHAAVREITADAVRSQVPPALSARPGTDAAAALHWRTRMPSARRQAKDADAVLTRTVLRPDTPAPDHAAATALTARHALLGRLLALTDAEHAARHPGPDTDTIRLTADRAVRQDARSRDLDPAAVHHAATAAGTAAPAAVFALLDRNVETLRVRARETAATHFPHLGGRLGGHLVRTAGDDDAAVQGLLGALEAVMDLPAPPPGDDTARRLAAHHDQLAQQPAAAAAAALRDAFTQPRRPALPAAPHPRPATPANRMQR